MIIPYDTHEEAVAADQKAFAFTGANGNRWADIYTDGKRFGVLLADAVVGAFSPDELARAEEIGEVWKIYATVANEEVIP